MTNTIKRDTGAAKMPSFQRLNLQDKALANWVQSATEWMEVRSGSRGNDNERAVTVRELKEIAGSVTNLTQVLTKEPGEGEMGIDLGGGFTATVAVDKFAQSIIDSRLFKDLAKTLDDPTRFDHLASEIRDVLLQNIADEAAKRGAAIQDMQTIIQTNERSMAMVVRELTASVREASAGQRQLAAVWSDGQRAMATNVLQLQASLGKYYQDGTPGRAMLEQEMTVIAGYTEGLRAQYTLKVQAGGALAGFGIAAEESVDGKTSSAFIISADKFAIVMPSYSGGMMKTPRPEDVVFGVDNLGIYLQRNVYLKGNIRIDGSGIQLKDGMRGSVMLSASGSAWSDATARQAVWQALGNTGSAPNNNHLLVGDAVTITNDNGFAQTRHWMGTAWTIPAAVINGDLLVDGTVAARKVDTRGLTVRDNSGNVILDANGVDAAWVRNIKASGVSGLGALATKNDVQIGSTVKLPDGTVLGTGDFINRLSKITSNNISVFMDTAAIGTAYIGQAAVGTLQIGGAAVTAMNFGEGGALSVPGGGSRVGAQASIRLPANSSGAVVMGMAEVNAAGGDATITAYLRRNGTRFAYAGVSVRSLYTSQVIVIGHDKPVAEADYTYDIEIVSPTSGPGSNQPINVFHTVVTVTGGKR
ncbi:DUF1983 domain-containing protein [Diaphorobacter sp. HDW4B]|uniref:phage tail tip fiber protein n=1 Tax=Diaphorobacter sp. HDW4B TaxID=2714925 RepID=UPI00140B4D8E|nr:DUF1983 domain-containing protein [Diaphorobacter sp. HDW4B]QIL69513.1 DUF1983 domain-containing protein [Diaphorobacter sp. HDW4B]